MQQTDKLYVSPVIENETEARREKIYCPVSDEDMVYVELYNSRYHIELDEQFVVKCSD